MSVWDAPQAVGADATERYEAHGVDTTPNRDVPLSNVDGFVKGTQGGRGLLDAHGRGVYNGVPLGETRQALEQSLENQYRLRPDWLAKLRAASRAPLGR